MTPKTIQAIVALGVLTEGLKVSPYCLKYYILRTEDLTTKVVSSLKASFLWPSFHSTGRYYISFQSIALSNVFVPILEAFATPKKQPRS